MALSEQESLEANLMHAWQGGDEKAGDALVIPYYPAIFAFHRVRTRYIETAHDLTQETFRRATRGKALYDPQRGSVRAWLYWIARNTRLDFLRSVLRTAKHLGRQVSLGACADLASPATELNFCNQDLERVVQSLPRFHRDVAGLLMADLTDSERAAAMDLPLRTFQDYKQRLLNYLRAVLTAGPWTRRPPVPAVPRGSSIYTIEKE